jgi:hypothetical protein
MKGRKILARTLPNSYGMDVGNGYEYPTAGIPSKLILGVVRAWWCCWKPPIELWPFV